LLQFLESNLFNDLIGPEFGTEIGQGHDVYAVFGLPAGGGGRDQHLASRLLFLLQSA